jgi:hypothetical protein
MPAGIYIIVNAPLQENAKKVQCLSLGHFFQYSISRAHVKTEQESVRGGGHPALFPKCHTEQAERNYFLQLKPPRFILEKYKLQLWQYQKTVSFRPLTYGKI